MSTPREELLRLLVDQAQDYALLLLDPQGRVTGWLAGAEHIFGYQPDEILGQPASLLFTPEDVERGLSDHELEVARHNGRAEDDRWQVRKDGTRIWANGVLIPLRDPQGQLLGFGKILRDRTDVKERLAALESRLEDLLKAQQRKDQFLGMLAHELRNPLAPLVNAVQLLQLAVPGHEPLAYPVQLIERQVDFLRRLLDDLLDLTRIGVGKIDLKMQPVDLNELLRRIMEARRGQAGERRQHVELLVPSGPIRVEADPSRLQQVFVNLLTNAMKYTPEGGRIWLKATVEGEEAVVRVEDTGVGISPEVLPQLFTLFTQEASSHLRSEGGLGIGLSLVKSLVTLHGGSVQVRSEGKGKGSEFTVRLPVLQPAEQETPSAGEP